MQPLTGLADLAGEHVTIAGPVGVNPHLKIPCLVAGMAAGADSIDDMNVLRYAAMTEVFGGIRAPSTLGSFLRSFTWTNVRQVDAVGRRLLAWLAWLASGDALTGAGGDLQRYLPRPQQRRGWTRLKAIS